MDGTHITISAGSTDRAWSEIVIDRLTYWEQWSRDEVGMPTVSEAILSHRLSANIRPHRHYISGVERCLWKSRQIQAYCSSCDYSLGNHDIEVPPEKIHREIADRGDSDGRKVKCRHI